MRHELEGRQNSSESKPECLEVRLVEYEERQGGIPVREDKNLQHLAEVLRIFFRKKTGMLPDRVLEMFEQVKKAALSCLGYSDPVDSIIKEIISELNCGEVYCFRWGYWPGDKVATFDSYEDSYEVNVLRDLGRRTLILKLWRHSNPDCEENLARILHENKLLNLMDRLGTYRAIEAVECRAVLNDLPVPVRADDISTFELRCGPIANVLNSVSEKFQLDQRFTAVGVAEVIMKDNPIFPKTANLDVPLGDNTWLRLKISGGCRFIYQEHETQYGMQGDIVDTWKRKDGETIILPFPTDYYGRVVMDSSGKLIGRNYTINFCVTRMLPGITSEYLPIHKLEDLEYARAVARHIQDCLIQYLQR
ncbi:MAG: hypothetical protein NZM26_04085 [Patescibacteria group bacterium]|nr:hypothetical protein [Patescibacteria group bacterium]